MRTDELDFFLPPELIAQEPVEQRSDARLLHYRRQDGSVSHRRYHELPELLRAGDLLVFNDTRVLPARFMLRKSSGGAIEGLFLEECAVGSWRVLLRNAGRLAPKTRLQVVLEPEVFLELAQKLEEGAWRVSLSPPLPAAELLGRIGRMPLPPYIRRQKVEDPHDSLDLQRYQTVFASAPGAVAAPTAALHFSQPLLSALQARGVERAFVTLHVGPGTFKPITADRLEDHVMHSEPYTINDSAAEALNRARKEQRRIIAVGTTAARVLESQPPEAPFRPVSASTDIFIRPPYRWKHVSSLVTNFHLPRSTLIALVAAMIGLDAQRQLYGAAIEQRYRFFSYGDGMWIE